MKYTIDEDVCAKHGFTVDEVFLLLAIKSSESTLDELIAKLLHKEKIVSGLFQSCYFLTEHWDDELSATLLESDNCVPQKDNCSELANILMQLFPKGLKTGNSAWRGNNRDITLRLQKFFKLYGNKWTPEEIIDATKRYVEHFNGDYTYMRILKYFIMKSERKLDEEGHSHIEDVSELATWLENDTEVDNTDWLTEIR